jgi:guanylate kinase
MPETLSCFILPPSIQALEHRLIARGQNSEESIARRLSEATIEIAAAVNFKFLFVNEDFAGCLEQLLSVIKASRQKTSVQINRPEIKKLLSL